MCMYVHFACTGRPRNDYAVLGGTLNPTHSFTHWFIVCLYSFAGMCTRLSEPRRDRDVQNFVRDETFKIRDETETRRCSFRDAGRDVKAPETLESREL